jgi:transcription antitermination factor NusG
LFALWVQWVQSCAVLAFTHPDNRCGRVGWAVIRTHPQAERRALEAIGRRGYRAYLPVCAVRGRRAPKVVPLFPRYAFVALPHGEPWTPVRYAEGVHLLIMNDAKPAYVPDGTVELLQAGDEVRSVIPEPGSAWRPGDACLIMHGAFAGMDAVVDAIDGQKLLISVLFFGQMRSISLTATSLRERIG